MGRDVFLSFLAVILALCVVVYVGRAPQSPFEHECADLFFEGGTIWTGTDRSVQAVAVTGRYIVAAGSYEEVAPYYCPQYTTAIPLHGKMMTPGWIDTHVHSLLGGMDLMSLQVHDVTSHHMLKERIRDYIRDHLKPGEWLLGSGWNQERFEGDEAGISPDRHLIDDISGENPVWLCRMDLHQCLTNTLALKLAGIDPANPPKVHGGLFAMDEETGEVTGIVKDNAMAEVVKALPQVSQEAHLKGLQTAMNYFVSNGVTSINQVVIDIFSSIEEGWTSFEALYESTLPGRFQFDGSRSLHATPFVRTYFAPALAHYALVPEFAKNHTHIDPLFLRTGAVKGFFDGSLGSYTAKMFEPYADNIQGGPEDNTGIFLIPETDMYEWVKGADERGLQVCVHAIGTQAVHELLNVYERVSKENPDRADRRFRIEHCQHLIEEDIQRLSELGVIASSQPYHMVDDALFIDRAIGEKRRRTAYPFRSLLDHNTTIVFGSDWNVAPASPILGIHAAVTRSYLDMEGKRHQFVPEQCITVEEALHAYTTAAAFSERTEDIKGKIAPGYLADLVVIDQVITKIDPFDIPKTNVDLTLLDGQIVYQSNNIRVIPASFQTM